MIKWIDRPQVRWLEPRTDWLGQSSQHESETTKGFSTVEKILLASVIISGVGLVIHVLQLTGHIGAPNAKT